MRFGEFRGLRKKKSCSVFGVALRHVPVLTAKNEDGS